MNNALELLNNINWFLEPVKNFILFLFTSKTGFWLLILGFAAYMIIPAWESVKMRRLAYKAAASFSTGRISIAEKIYLVGKSFSKSLSKIISNIPILIISFLILLFIVAISSGITAVDDYVKNQQKISELKTVLKQLDQRYKVAEIEILDYSYTKDSTSMEIRFFDSSLGEFSDNTQALSIKGNDIYFDAIVMNFDYSQITDNRKVNLVLPYRIFSNKIPQGKGQLLELKDKNGVPLVYKRNKTEVFGISPELYNEHIKEFATYLQDDEAARKAGVRSTQGNAVHKRIRKGSTLEIWVEQTGGLVIKDKRDF
ncbi:MAG: hypothetical protein U9N85_01805 [Bacteroidota bacterium]|nr:hypothetical protein [Bacteroidota bacterium]